MGTSGNLGVLHGGEGDDAGRSGDDAGDTAPGAEPDGDGVA
jgi:hypothetical protein